MLKEWLAICNECELDGNGPVPVGPGDVRYCPCCGAYESLREVEIVCTSEHKHYCDCITYEEV